MIKECFNLKGYPNHRIKENVIIKVTFLKEVYVQYGFMNSHLLITTIVGNELHIYYSVGKLSGDEI